MIVKEAAITVAVVSTRSCSVEHISRQVLRFGRGF